MMSRCLNLVVLLVFLTAGSCPPSLLFAHAVHTSPPANRSGIFMMDFGDYDYDTEDHSSPPIVASSRKPLQRFHESKPCQYDPCLENQEPCFDLSDRTGCLCPGLSGADQAPHAPRLQELVPVSDGDGKGKVEVKWCAPSSVVSGYKVVVEGSTRETLEFDKMVRRGVLGSLELGATVCVEAVNRAGHSTPSEFSCKRYDPPDNSNHTLRAGVIGGGVALLLLLCLTAVILWKSKVCQKTKRDSSDGLGNPSYSTEGNL